MTMRETKGQISRWFEERLGLEAIRQFIAHKTVPLHSATPWYYFGGITLFLFILQVLTGVLLLLYYRPTPSEAYESVQFIMTRVQFGWLVRSVHSWSANLMILAAFIHMFSVVFLHAYRKPRELTWLSGVVLLGLVVSAAFLPLMISGERKSLEEMSQKIIKPVKPLPPVDLIKQEALLRRMQTPLSLDFKETNKLFNSLPWQRTG